MTTAGSCHDSRVLAEVAGEKGEFAPVGSESEDARAVELCAEAMRNAVLIADEVIAPPGAPHQIAPVETPDREKEVAANGVSIKRAMAKLADCAKKLRELQTIHRKMTLGSVAGGAASAEEAFARVDSVRRLEALARHARLCAAHLVDAGA